MHPFSKVPLYISLVFAMLFGAMALAQKQALEPLEPPALPTEEERAKAEAAAKERAELPPPEEITERREGNQVITEYRRFGQVYMIKIKPKVGASQYMVDRDGDGRFETKTENLSEEFDLPKWRIGTW